MKNVVGFKASQAILPAGSVSFRLAVDANEVLNVISFLNEKEKDGVDLSAIQTQLGDTGYKLGQPAIQYLLGESLKSGHLTMEDGKYKMAAPKRRKKASSAGKKKTASKGRKSSAGKKKAAGSKKKAGARKKASGAHKKKASGTKKKTSARKKAGRSKKKTSGGKRMAKAVEDHPM